MHIFSYLFPSFILTTAMLSFTLGFPPSLNSYYKKYNNRIIISKAGKDYQEQVKLIAMGRPMSFDTKDRLRMDMLVYPPDLRHRDLDNLLKCTADSLQNAGVFPNDSQLDCLHVVRCKKDKHNPRVEVTLSLFEMEEVLCS